MESRDVLAFAKKYWRHPVTLIAECGIAVLILHLFGLLIPLLRLVFTILLAIAALGLLYSIIRFALRKRALARGQKAQGGSRDNKIGFACGGAAAVSLAILLLLPSSKSSTEDTGSIIASNREQPLEDSSGEPKENNTDESQQSSTTHAKSRGQEKGIPSQQTKPAQQEASPQPAPKTPEPATSKAIKLTDYPKGKPTSSKEVASYSFDKIVTANKRRAEDLLPKITSLYADILVLKKYHLGLLTLTSEDLYEDRRYRRDIKRSGIVVPEINHYMAWEVWGGDNGFHWVVDGEDRDDLDAADLGGVFFHSLNGEDAYHKQQEQDKKQREQDSALLFGKPKTDVKQQAYRDSLQRIIDIHRDCLRGRLKLKTNNETLISHLRTLPDPDAMLSCWNRCRETFRELHKAYTDMSTSFEPPPAKTRDDGSLVYVGGITHIVNGDEYYIENKVINIPKKYLRLYSEGSDGANKVGIMGNFRFVGNAKGKNALGATVNVELYECDTASAESQLAEQFAKSDPKYRAYRDKFVHPEFNEVLEDRPLEAMLLTYRKLVGDEAFNKAIERAK